MAPVVSPLTAMSKARTNFSSMGDIDATALTQQGGLRELGPNHTCIIQREETDGTKLYKYLGLEVSTYKVRLLQLNMLV